MAKKFAIDMEYFRQMDSFETAVEEGPFTTDFDRLIKAGIALPAPESMQDQVLKAKLWAVIQALANMKTFIHHTDHLSDRELYGHLWKKSLREPVIDLSDHSHVAAYIDLLGGWDDEDLQVYLKYYADESYRQMWAEDFPEDVIPPTEPPPYDRDRFLPQPV